MNVPTRKWGMKPPLGSRLDLSNPLSQGLRGLWLFNEGQGLSLYDASGYGNTGSIVAVNSATAQGMWGQSGLLFDGTNENVSIGAGIESSITAQLSVFALIIPTGFNDIEPVCGETYTNSSSKGACLFTYNSGQLYFDVGNGSTSGRADTATGALTAGKQAFICGTYDGKNVKVYANGQVGSTVGTVTGPISWSGAGITFGLAGGFYYAGRIIMLGISSIGFSSAQVSSLDTDPYQMILPPAARKMYSIPGSGGAVLKPWLGVQDQDLGGATSELGMGF